MCCGPGLGSPQNTPHLDGSPIKIPSTHKTSTSLADSFHKYCSQRPIDLYTPPTPIPLNYCLIFLPFHMPAQEISCLRFIFQSRSSFPMWGPTENSLAIEDCFLHHFLSKYKFLWLAMFELSLKTHVTRKTHCFSLCISVSPHCGHMLPSHGHLLHSMLLLALWPQYCLWKKKTKCFFYSIWFHPKRLDSSMR